MTQRTTSNAACPQIKPAGLRTFHTRLMAWYKAHGRHALPWRQTDDPYHIWLSEVMLQQTQVATVRDRFYFAFLKKFPTIAALAAAEQTEVMKAWEGLGYYSRARNLHAAAKIVVSRESSVLSKNFNKKSAVKDKRRLKMQSALSLTTDDARLTTLLSLPGIGRNTAHAIAAFAYHQPVAILEANIKRVVARIFALKTPSDAELWAGANALLNHAHPFDYNQAMMDLGSLLCTPKKPNCAACPASSLCAGKAAPEQLPTPKAKKQVPTRHVTIHVREDGDGRLFLEKRDEALLGGLYGFPQASRESSVVSHEQKKAKDSRLTTHDYLGKVTHTYSHFKLIGTVIHERLPSKTNSADWYTRAHIAALPLSKLDHKVLALIENRRIRSDKISPHKIKAQRSAGKD